MTVIDIRNVFSDRQTEMVDLSANYIYYTEKKAEDGRIDLYLLEYNRKTRKERLVMNYSLDDPAFEEHVFVFDRSMLVIFENGSNSLWLIELDKKTGAELNRRKIVCTGRFSECMAIDADHVLIFMAPDEENAEVFRKYEEVTGCQCLCYLYNVRTNRKYFVNAPILARLGCANIRPLTVEGQSYIVLAEPFSDEATKEHYYSEQRWVNADIRDNIWLCSAQDMINDIEQGSDSITKRCIASADIKALVRYMGSDDSKVYFRAKEFRTGIEKVCSYDIATGALAVEATMQPPKGGYFIVEEKPFRVFSVRNSKEHFIVQGVINSQADFAYPEALGSLITCLDSRYALVSTNAPDGDASGENTAVCLYDPVTDKQETYDCACVIKGDDLILY